MKGHRFFSLGRFGHVTKTAALLSLVFLITVPAVSASKPAVVRHQSTWAETFASDRDLNFFNSAVQTSDGGVIVAGLTGDVTWILKLDDTGTIQWQRFYGCGGAVAIHQASDGSFIVGGSDCILKLDGTGGIIWEKGYSGAETNTALSLEEKADGGFIEAGITSSPVTYSIHAFLLNLDTVGNVVWQKTYGATGRDWLATAKQTLDGGFIAEGETNSFGSGGYDAWAVRLDSQGTVLWQKTYGGPGSSIILSIFQQPDGSFIAAGDTSSTQGIGFDAWILKLDSSGNVLWQRAYGPEAFTSLVPTFDGGFVAAGELGGGAGFLKLDSDGNVVWQRVYGGSRGAIALGIAQTAEGGFIGTGYTQSFSPLGNPDQIPLYSWVLRLDPRGNIRGNCDIAVPSNVTVRSTEAQVTTTTATVEDISTTVTAIIEGSVATQAIVQVQCLPKPK